MIRLHHRLLAAGASLLTLVVVLALAELAGGEVSAADVGVFGLLALIAVATLVLLRAVSRSLSASLAAQGEVQTRLSQQQAVAALGQLALRDASEQELLDEACRSVAAELGADLASVLELLPDTSAFVLRAASGWPAEQVGVERVPTGPRSQAGYTIRTSAPVIMRDAATEARFELSPHMATQRVKSGVSTTIGRNGGTYGVLAAHTYALREFSNDDVTFLEAIAAMLASALGRRAAVEEADQTHRVLEAVIEGTTDHVFVNDIEGRHIAVNGRWADAFGLSRDEVIGRTLHDILPGPQARAVEANDRIVLERGTVENFEETFQLQGETRIFLTTKGPYRARDGTLLGTFGIARDITERKAEEAALARSEERFRLAQHGARMGTWDVDLLTGTTTWSEGLYRIFGVDDDYPAGLEHFLPLVHPDDRDWVTEQVESAYAVGGEFEFECRLLRPDGAIRWALARTTSLRSDAGTPTRILGVLVDITERKVAEQRLMGSEETLRLAQQAVHLGAWDWSADTRVLQWTPAVYEIFGLDPDSYEPRYETMLAYVHPDDRPAIEDAFESVVADGKSSFDLACRIVQPCGQTRWMLTRGSIVRDADGRVTRVLGVALDDTERKDAEAERGQLEGRLRQAETLEIVGRLAGGVAHDFNNLLLGIRGYGELALARLESGDGDVADDVDAILRAADRGAGLTRQLLAFGRRQVLNPEVLDLNRVVRETAGLLRRVIGEDVELVTQLADGPVIAKVDRGQLEQVITNLALNGRHAMQNGGTLVISVETAQLDDGAPGETQPYALISVADDGAGIDDAAAPHIFEPFFTTKGDEGTGLGLATVHGIVTQSGGRIVVDSELGRGSTFRVYLPLCTEDLPPALEAAPAPSAPGTETILLVEDDPTVRSIVAMMLAAHGYAIVEASSGEQAISLFAARTEPIHLVVSDLVMRGLDGRETSDRIRALAPDTRVLYMSGYTDDAIIRSGRLGPGTGFIQKPFSGGELALCVRDVLNGTAQPEPTSL